MRLAPASGVWRLESSRWRGAATILGDVVVYGAEDFCVYTLSLRQGRLSAAFCTYPPALVIVQADGSLSCPMLWGTTGKVRRASGRLSGKRLEG